MTNRTEALTMRGEFFVGNVDPYDPNASTSVANAMTSLGIVSKFTLTPTTERVKLPEWKTGGDGVVDSWTRSTGGKIQLLADEANPFNLALNLAGRVRYMAPESVTSAFIAAKNNATGKWSKLNGTTSLASSVPYAFVKSISSDGLSVDTYENIDTTTFVLTDSSVTPKVLVPAVDYTIYGTTGTLKFINTASKGINTPGLTYPIKASFDVGLVVDTLPNPLAANMPYMLSYKNISNVSVKDSAGTPIPNTCYEIDADYGMITITDLAAVKAITLISGTTSYRSIKVFALRGSVATIGIMSEPRIDKQVRMNGINVRTRQKLVVTLWKVSFDTSAVDFFDKDYAKIPLEGELMSDQSRPYDNALGQFGIIEYL